MNSKASLHSGNGPVFKDPQGQRISDLELVVTEMDAHIQHLHNTLAQLARAEAMAEDDDQASIQKPMRDKVWACSNCNARLGIYNAQKDELRIRYKDFVAYVHPGTGGYTMVPCRRCGEQNRLDNAE